MIDLDGLQVLVTRPETQTQAWCDTLAHARARPLPVPMMELVALSAPEERQAIKQCAMDFDLYQKAIFVSQNAVTHALEWLDSYWPQWPVGIEYFAVGERTAAVLSERGLRVTALQSHGPMNSEALLQAPQLQREAVDNQRIVIFRGRGGRGVMGTELRARGARVDYCELYQRRCPDNARQNLEAAMANTVSGPLVVALHSGETLNHYSTLLQQLPTEHPARRRLDAAALVVPGERVARQAKHLGFERVITAENATDPSMLAALQQALSQPELFQTDGTHSRD